MEDIDVGEYTRNRGKKDQAQRYQEKGHTSSYRGDCVFFNPAQSFNQNRGKARGGGRNNENR